MSTEHRESDLIRSWLDESYEAEADPQDYLEHLLDEVPETPQQRRRWWAVPLFRREDQAPTATPTATTEYQPNPIPASNGQTPTVIGRTQSMLSPAKAITAGAIIAAVGGVFLIAQPFNQQGGGVPGAATDTETTPASLVTGEMGWATNCSSPTPEVDGDVVGWLDRRCAPQTWTADDLRLSGQATSTWNTVTYPVDGELKSVIANAYYVRNELGGWACRSYLLVDGSGSGGSWEGVETVMCEGEGEYDGLSAIIDFDEPISRDGMSDAQPMVGLIFPGDAPPHPAPPAAE